MTSGDHAPITFTENIRRDTASIVVFLSICVVLLSSCGNATVAAPPTSKPTSIATSISKPVVGITRVSITMTAKFDPASIQVPAGTTVTWTNNDNVGHTVTFRNSIKDSGVLLAGGKQLVPDTFASKQNMKDSGILLAEIGTVSFTFTSKGTFPYYDAINPSIHGVVIVT
jgi:plastocyanin